MIINRFAKEKEQQVVNQDKEQLQIQLQQYSDTIHSLTKELQSLRLQYEQFV